MCVLLVLVMARYVRACYCAKMPHKFRARFRLQFFAVIALPKKKLFYFFIFRILHNYSVCVCVSFFIRFSLLNLMTLPARLASKSNCYRVLSVFFLFFFRTPFSLSFYLIVCCQTDALNASRKWLDSMRFDDFKGQKETPLSGLIFMNAN